MHRDSSDPEKDPNGLEVDTNDTGAASIKAVSPSASDASGAACVCATKDPLGSGAMQGSRTKASRRSAIATWVVASRSGPRCACTGARGPEFPGGELRVRRSELPGRS